MGEVPLAFAFAAGLVATVNPCGFALLPAYLSWFIGTDTPGAAGAGAEAPVRGMTVARALLTGSVVSAGFLTVFGTAGALVTVGFRSVIDFVPWAALLIGVGLAVLGAALLAGHQVKVMVPQMGGRSGAGSSRRLRSMYLFGVSYAVASLSCALPVFLAVVGVAQATTSLVAGVVTFLAYGAGMSMLLMVLTLALALARDGMVRRLRGLLPHVSRISGGVLVVAGLYVAAFWVANLRDPLASGDTTFQVVEDIQRWLSGELGNRPATWAVVFGLVLVGASAYALRSRRHAPLERSGEKSGENL